jgi:hypothetical protein
MARYIKHSSIDKARWDQLINASQTPSVFALSWYLDIASPGWGALIEDDYKAALPLAVKRKLGIPFLIQPFFTRYFSVFSENNLGQVQLQAFLDAIPSNIPAIDFCLHESFSGAKGFKITERKFQQLELNVEYAKLEKDFSLNARRNIKKASKAGLKARGNVSPEAIVELFKSTKGIELQVFKPKDYENLLRLMHKAIQEGAGQSIGIYNGQDLCAAGFFLFHQGRFTFLKSGVSQIGKEAGAMFLLFDDFIRKNAGKEAILDFGGSSVESVARFYKNFGAKDCLYLRLQKSPFLKLFNRK